LLRVRNTRSRRSAFSADDDKSAGETPTRDTPMADQGSVRSIGMTIIGGGAVGVVVLGTFALAVPDGSSRPAVFSVLVMLAAATAAAGGLVGFLFGIPRSMQEPRPATGAGSAAADERGGYQANTNLEQISDWLTKILVGVGLIQLGKIGGLIGGLVDDVANGIGGRAVDRLMVGATLVLFTIFGFLASYLLTRLLLQRAFTVADMSAVAAVARREVDRQARRQQNVDADAYSLVARTLQPPAGADPPSQSELNRVLTAASPIVRSQAFSLVRNQRLTDEKTAKGRKCLPRTMMVFRALIGAEPSSHRNHGQLGYALRCVDPPQRAEAERSFTTAIALRDAAAEQGWLHYELNRAAVRIEQDAALGGTPPPERKAMILVDLCAAASDPELVAEIHRDATMQTWLTANAPELTTLLTITPAHTTPL